MKVKMALACIFSLSMIFMLNGCGLIWSLASLGSTSETTQVSESSTKSTEAKTEDTFLTETEPTTESTTVHTTEQTSQPPTEKPTESYNEIQSIFIGLNFDTTSDDIESIISNTSLEHSKNEYNGYTSYQFSYTSGAALQKYGDGGEYVKITFDNNNGAFMYAEYEDYENFVISLLYNYGNYYDLTFRDPQNSYSGYYYYKPGDSSKKGVTLKYNNGYEKQTHYISSLDAEESLMHPAYR